jgi:hypothetical protein
MRFLCYTLGDENVPMPPRSPEKMAELGPFMAQATKSGVLLATGGLGPTSEGVKVQYSDGSFTVTDGPFSEAKELIGGWLLIELPSKEDAIGWMKRLLRITGGEARVRQTFGPEDHGSNGG